MLGVDCTGSIRPVAGVAPPSRASHIKRECGDTECAESEVVKGERPEGVHIVPKLASKRGDGPKIIVWPLDEPGNASGGVYREDE